MRRFAPLLTKYIFWLEAIFLLPVNTGTHADYQIFVVKMLRKYYPDPSKLARSTWNIIDRFWASNENYLSPNIHPLKLKVKRPRTKGSKADSVEKVTVAQLLPELENTTFDIDDQPYGSLFKLYKNEFLNQSVKNGLIKPDSLALAGDGTPIVTSHRERKHRICDCKEKGITNCKCDRYFSQPDCDIGWDSSRDCFYHRYDLYILVASDSESDLPIFPLLSQSLFGIKIWADCSCSN